MLCIDDGIGIALKMESGIPSSYQYTTQINKFSLQREHLLQGGRLGPRYDLVLQSVDSIVIVIDRRKYPSTMVSRMR